MGAASLPSAWQLYLKDHRISTFKNWPFLEGCACTPERVRLRGLPGSGPPHRVLGGLPVPARTWNPTLPGATPPAGLLPAPPAPGRPAHPRAGPVWPAGTSALLSALQMAAAGFIHCPTENEPDLAQCFFCFKELEGWEPDDDPV